MLKVKKYINTKVSMALHLEGDLKFACGSVCHSTCWPPAQFPHLPPSVQEEEKKERKRKREEEGEKKIQNWLRGGHEVALGSGRRRLWEVGWKL